MNLVLSYPFPCIDAKIFLKNFLLGTLKCKIYTCNNVHVLHPYDIMGLINVL